MGDLHGIAAAQARRLRAVLALEPLELALPATDAVAALAQLGDREALEDVLPDVNENQVAVDCLGLSGEDLDRPGRLVTRHDIVGRAEHSRGLACRSLAGTRPGWDDAAQARRLARDDGHCLPVRPDR